MPRIRSVHPGLFTDEAFVSLSDAAQILLIGLWTECDDQGAFEWKPLTLRMRLRQNRDGPVEPLLAEMEALNCIMSYEHKGRKLGLVRNFRKWQRPKKPNKVYFVPPEFGTYTLPAGNSSEPDHDEQDDVPNSPPFEATSVPPKAELAPQREEEGGRRLDEGGERKKEVQPQAADPPPSQILEIAKTAWNELASDTGIPCVQNFNESRKRALVLRLGDLGGIEGFHALCGKIRGSPMLCGKNERGWKASFDWVLKPANLTKIMEGNYDAADNSHSKPGSITGAFAELDAAIAEARRREAGTSGDAGQEIVGWQT